MAFFRKRGDGKGLLRTVGGQPRRLELLTAFGILNGHYPSRDEIVNESIRQYFMRVYEEYCNKADPDDMMLRMMEEAVS